MATKIANVYCFEYEMNESMWKAYIAGFSQEEAHRKLVSSVMGRIKRILATQYISRLDNISDEMRNDIVMPEVMKVKMEQKDTSTTPNKITTKIKS